MTCALIGCGLPKHRRGLCQTHYRLTLKTGSPFPAEREPRLCRVDGCDRRHKAHGWCQRHYQIDRRRREKVKREKARRRAERRKKARELMGTKPKRTPTRLCEVEGCVGGHLALGLCRLHYDRLRRYGGAHCGACEEVQVMFSHGWGADDVARAVGWQVDSLRAHLEQHMPEYAPRFRRVA